MSDIVEPTEIPTEIPTETPENTEAPKTPKVFEQLSISKLHNIISLYDF